MLHITWIASDICFPRCVAENHIIQAYINISLFEKREKNVKREIVHSRRIT